MTYGRGGPPLWTLMWLHICIFSATLEYTSVLKLSSADLWGGVPPFEFSCFKKNTQSGGVVQQDAGYHHFMWVQCRREQIRLCSDSRLTRLLPFISGTARGKLEIA